VRTRLARLLNVHTDERAWRIGADGEETVGSRLQRLMKGDKGDWLVLHDIVLNSRGTNLDHLVIGPAGIYSINTKHRPKAKVIVTARSIRINGYREAKYLPAAVAEASTVARTLQLHAGFPLVVHPVIVLVGAELNVRTPPAHVSVIQAAAVPNCFKRLPVVLPEAQLKELQRVAGRPATWRPPEPAEKLVVKSWSRYGKKRTYVNDAAGKTLGYRDELTGEVHVEDAKDLERVRGALPGLNASMA